MDAQTNVISTGQKIRTVDITVTAALQVPSAADYLILLADISTGLFQHC